VATAKVITAIEAPGLLTPSDHLEAAGGLDGPRQRKLVRRGLRTGQDPVRLAALEWLGELHGAEAAHRRTGSDPDAAVLTPQ
jgi:hypothetical protein